MKKLLLFFGILLAKISFGQSITIDPATPTASCADQNVTVNFTPANGAIGPYTVELIETFDRSSPYFCVGTNISTKASASTSSNSVTLTIPSGLNTSYTYIPNGFCSGNYFSYGVEIKSYTFKVTGSNATSPTYNITLSSTCTPTLGVAIAPSSICAGKIGNVSWLSVGANNNNVFTMELSNSSGSFSSPVLLGTLSGNNVDGYKTQTVMIPANTSSGSGYLIKVKSSDPVSEKTFGLTVKPVAECGPIQTPTINTPVCSGATKTVSWVNDGAFDSGNIFTVELDVNSSFTSPTTIGTITSQTATSASVTIPNNLAFNNYYVRVKASNANGNPYIGPVSNNFQIGLPTLTLNASSSVCENAVLSLAINTYSYSPESNYSFNWIKDNVSVNSFNQSTNTSNSEENFKRNAAQASDAGTYKVVVVRNADGCSVESTSQLITIATPPASPTISPLTVLSGNTASLTATNCTGIIRWYNSQAAQPYDNISSGTYTTPELTQQTTYYAACQQNSGSQCYSSKTPLVVSIDATNAPNAPILTASDNDFCSGVVQSPKLTATGCNGIVRWYQKNGPNFSLQETDNTTPHEFYISNSTTRVYAADCRENNVLSTLKAEFLVTVKPIPSPPSPNPSYQTINSGSDTQNNVYGTDCINGIVKWYDASSGGNLLFIGRTYIQSNVTSSYSVYTSCTENGCESSYRNSANVNVQTSGVAAPSFYTENETICGSGTATIFALGCTQGTVNWYTYFNSAYTLVGTGQTYTTPTLTYSSNTSSYQFYADCTIGVTSSTKNSKYIYLNRQPSTPSANQPTIACNTSTTLTATGCTTTSPEYFTVYWYESANSTSSLSSSTSFTTPVLSATTTYYLQCSGSNCKSPRVPITVTVGCTPPDPPVISSSATAVCAGTSVNLTATGCSNTVNWSDGGTGTTRNNVIFNASLTLTATCNNGLTSGNSNSISIMVNPKPNLFITNPAAVSPPNTVDITLSTLTAGSTLNGATLSYHSDAAGNVTLTNPPPNAINESGTYYIKALTTAGCADIKPVVVVISDCGTAVVLQSPTDDYSSGTTLKKTNETILANNKITGNANVVYRSNKSITLDPGSLGNPGFKAEAGVVFKAEIGGCN